MEAPVLNFTKLKLSHHADIRMKERLDKRSNKDKLQICKSTLGQSKYLGLNKCEKGKLGHMYSNGTFTIIVGTDLETIVSVYPTKDKGYIVQTERDNPLHKKLTKLYETELRKYDRIERSKERLLTRLKLETEIEKAELKYRMYKTRSETVKASCAARMKEINTYVTESESGLKKIQDDKRKIARAMACIV